MSTSNPLTSTRARTLPLSKRGLNFEMLMWIYTRLSALGMYFFMLIALIGALYMGARYQMSLADLMRWLFMPNVSHVEQVPTIQNIDAWATVFWKLVASGMYLLATSHGVHGLVVIADDYIVSPTGRKTVRFLSILMMISMVLIGLYLIWQEPLLKLWGGAQ